MTNNSISLKDLYFFFKDHFKIYIISFILSVAIVGGLFSYSIYSESKIETGQQKNPILFSFILENSQGNIVTSSGAVKQIFLTSLEDKQQFSQDALEKLNVTYNNIQNTIDVQFVKEVSEQEQKQISDFLQQEINNGNLAFFNNKKIYFINKEKGNHHTILPKNAGISSQKIILVILVIAVIAIGLGTLLVSWKEHKTKIITQKFTLGNDVQVIDIESLDLSTNKEKVNVIHSLLNGDLKTKFLVLEENRLINRKEVHKNDNIMIYSDLQNIIDPVPFRPEEILIICFKKNTTKQWYKKQVEIAKALTDVIMTIYI